ncbi:Holliday junction resolvase RuvX [Desulfurobacterium atlanticum]|uniref:Putative pre-16S rRNA nuclease n=1 Tax=Desulfurobacterium atlanticum TaxID=240169 RepID=A0A238Z473_9BACT|nr:Holliday junction resolvase RuvX [Desulfurobacterium atlanticum]SNR78126.1 putative holliday junction resolvase [Desulfurobacterium atlanticum]
MGQTRRNKKYLALDVGFKRIGVATSLSGIIASPSGIIERKTNRETFSEIERLIKKYGITTVIIGLPLTSNGKKTKMAEKIEKFAEKLKSYLENKKLNIEIVFQDEYLTTATAENLETLKKRNRKDDIAAALILEEFLSNRSTF